MQNNLTIKYILIGDSYVGKSCIAEQYTEEYFNASPPGTMGVELCSIKRNYIIEDLKYNINVSIFDTGGEINLESIIRTYYTRADYVILVFDLTTYETFENIKRRATDVKKALDDKHKYPPFILVGNKRDSIYKRVSQRHIDKFVKKNNMKYIEISAKYHNDVTKMFDSLNMEYLMNFIKNNKRFTIPHKEKNTRCCGQICNIS